MEAKQSNISGDLEAIPLSRTHGGTLLRPVGNRLAVLIVTRYMTEQGEVYVRNSQTKLYSPIPSPRNRTAPSFPLLYSPRTSKPFVSSICVVNKPDYIDHYRPLSL